MATRKFILLTPIILLFGLGILLRTAKVVNNRVSASETSACSPNDLTGMVSNDLVASYEGSKINIPSLRLANSIDSQRVLGLAKPDEKWVEVDLSEQKLRAWDGDKLFLESLVSTGLPGTPTPIGEFRVWIKLRATKMEGGEGRYYYNLPNVPYVMFFENEDVPGWLGYGLHGTYWHSDFGTRRSHGCVNLPTTIAQQIYYWSTPALPDGKNVVYADEENPGIRVIIHE